MRTRSALLTLGVVLLVATAGCAQVIGGSGSSPTPANANAAPENGTGQTIQVAASGSVGANPNQAIVRVAVVTTADDVATARQRLTENVSQMREALAAIGINSSQISTAHYDIRQEREPRREKQQQGQSSYRAIHSFRITLSDLNRTGKVIDTAVTNGANRVEGVQFAITQQKRQDLRQQALEAAMANARQQAATLAGTSGLTVTGVKRIQTGQPRYRGYDAAMTTAAGSAGGTDISSGTITVSVQVQVAYNATETE